jgi:hypothetical protein
MRVTDIMLAFPTVILALVITAALGAGIQNAVIAIMVAWWPSYARLVRGLVLAIKEREYVLVARALGASESRLLRMHVLRNIVSPVIILSTLDVGHAILTFASLGSSVSGSSGDSSGLHDRRRRGLLRSMVDGDLSGDRHPEPHDGLQHRRRQPQGHARSSTAKALAGCGGRCLMLPSRERDPYIAWRPPFPEPVLTRDKTALLVIDMQYRSAHPDFGLCVRSGSRLKNAEYYRGRLAMIVEHSRLPDTFRNRDDRRMSTSIHDHDRRDRSPSTNRPQALPLAGGDLRRLNQWGRLVFSKTAGSVS